MALFSEYPSSLSIRSNASRGLLMLKSLSLNETSITSDLNSSPVFVPAAVVRRCKSSSSTGEASESHAAARIGHHRGSRDTMGIAEGSRN